MSAWKVRARAELQKLEQLRRDREAHTMYDAGWAAGAAYVLAWLLDPSDPNIYPTPCDHFKQDSAPK